jgi:uncharacterized protein (DUF3820 family)
MERNLYTSSWLPLSSRMIFFSVKKDFQMKTEIPQARTGVSGDPDELLALAEMRMPFGKYRGRLLIDLPEPYVVWFAKKGFPEGKLGRMLQAMYEIKVNGLEYLFAPLRKAQENSIRREKK